MQTLLKIKYRWRFRERGLKSLTKEFQLTKQEITSLDRELKEQWVKNGKAKSVGYWLLACSLGVFSMITVGGYVRLNKAGLSMINWDLHKILPPMDHEEWSNEFDEYKRHPQFKNDFPNMSLFEFKKLYLLEFYHRQMGKALGGVFILPLLYFISRGYLKRRMAYSLLAILGIGSIQGFLGWWMVKSGLVDNLGHDYTKKDVKVAPYRLAVHFTTAVVIFGLLFKTSLFLIRTHPAINRSIAEYSVLRISRHAIFAATFWNFMTLVTGSIMAGNNAGKIVNTFPKMGDTWYPSKYHLFNPQKFDWFKDLLENQFLVHFNHRFIATFNLAVVIKNFYKIISFGIISSSFGKCYFTLTLVTIYQYCLGIVNVLTGCKKEFAHAHQFTGILAFALCIIGIATTRKPNANQLEAIFKRLLMKDRILLENKLRSLKTNSPTYYRHFFDKTTTKMNLNI